ncbi:MAG: lipopolysaccharide biosynthesis protein [Bryobacteraceae bacterium]
MPLPAPPSERAGAPSPSPASPGVAANVFWTAVGVVANLFTGVILSPYIIRRLGVDGYGIWSLMFALAGYCTLFDAGVRTAVVTFTARCRARSDWEGLNRILSTAFLCSSVGGVAILALTIVLCAHPASLFSVPEHYREVLRPVILTIGLSTALGLSTGVLTGCLEGFQRFDRLNRIRIAVVSVRAVLYAATLAVGYGLIQLTFWTLAANVVMALAYALALRSLCPHLRIGPTFVTRAAFKEIFHFGLPSSLAYSATVVIDQTPSLLLGRMLSAAAVGFYVFPLRLLQYPAEMITRVGVIAAPTVAEMHTLQRRDSIIRLGTLANRYNFLLFAPLAVFLLVSGAPLLSVWVGPQYALHSGPLIPVLVIGIWLGLASQFVSTAMLFGLGAHRLYSLLVAAEAVVVAAGGAWAIRTHGLLGLACVCSAALCLSRGLGAAVLLCRAVGYSPIRFFLGIYGRALAVIAPTYLLARYLSHSWLPGRNWFELGAVAVVVSTCIVAGALLFCIDHSHRRALYSYLRRLSHLARGAHDAVAPAAASQPIPGSGSPASTLPIPPQSEQS